MNTAGERLVEMRELKHLTQAKLAELIFMSPSQLNKYEKNKNNFTFGFRAKLATVFSDEDGKFDKDAMDEYMNKIYIENIWYFTKNNHN